MYVCMYTHTYTDRYRQTARRNKRQKGTQSKKPTNHLAIVEDTAVLHQDSLHVRKQQ